MVAGGGAHEGDPVVTRLVAEDKVAWYRKKNLRNLYLLLFPTCMGIEITSGFDSQLINALQGIEPWKLCTFRFPSPFPSSFLLSFPHPQIQPPLLLL